MAESERGIRTYNFLPLIVYIVPVAQARLGKQCWLENDVGQLSRTGMPGKRVTDIEGGILTPEPECRR